MFPLGRAVQVQHEDRFKAFPIPSVLLKCRFPSHALATPKPHTTNKTLIILFLER